MARFGPPALDDIEERAHGAILAPKQKQRRLDPPIAICRVMVEINARRRSINLTDRVARRRVAVASARLDDDARIERSLDLDLPGETPALFVAGSPADIFGAVGVPVFSHNRIGLPVPADEAQTFLIADTVDLLWELVP